MVNNDFISEDEWNRYINASLYELYDLLVQKYGDDYYVASPYQFTTDGTTNLIPLPDDCFKPMGLDIQLSPNNWKTVRKFNFANRNKFNPGGYLVAGFGSICVEYRVLGSNLMLIPAPTGSLTFQLWYAPKLSPLVEDSDTFDQISGWGEYVVCDAVIKALAKQEQDTSVFERQKAFQLERIESAAGNRDAGAPDTAYDATGRWDPYDGGGFY